MIYSWHNNRLYEEPRDVDNIRLITTALKEIVHRQARPDKRVNTCDVVASAINETDIIIVEQQYVVSYIVESSWIDTTLTLTEQFVSRVAPGDATIKDVIAALECAAQLHSADYISMGTAGFARQDTAQRYYSRYGFTAHATNMRKQVYGIC